MQVEFRSHFSGKKSVSYGLGNMVIDNSGCLVSLHTMYACLLLCCHCTIHHDAVCAFHELYQPPPKSQKHKRCKVLRGVVSRGMLGQGKLKCICLKIVPTICNI